MEEQRLVVHEQVLIEREPASTFDDDRCADALDPVGDLVYSGFELFVGNGHGVSLAVQSV